VSAPLRAVLATLKALLYGWLLALIALVRSLVSLCRSRRGMTNDEEHERKRARTRCVPIDDPAYVRPDPLIYDQYYLLQLGLNVTWENPDFAIFQGGVPVPSHLLKPDTVYDVVVRVWNASLDCPVVKMPVHLSYLSFGVGTVSHPIATQEIDVGVKGAPNNPAFLHFSWPTPPEEGHYCLQALLDPVADVEPRNNLGQHNTNVVATQSPATFTFALRNGITARRQFGFWTDTYELGPIGICTDDPEELRRRKAYHRDDHPLPAGWTVDISPPAPVLDPMEEIPVLVTVTPPSGWTGTQTVNVHAYYLDNTATQRLAGGVTVKVTGS
jgi:hypothetical protein